MIEIRKQRPEPCSLCFGLGLYESDSMSPASFGKPPTIYTCALCLTGQRLAAGLPVIRKRKRSWDEIAPKDALKIVLPHPDIQGPLNEIGQECPWPWEPQQLGGAPMGQFHCSHCGGMNIAGIPHLDWRGTNPIRRLGVHG